MTEARQGSTFDLHIAFAGMCLLVRDSERKDKRQMLHVLLPNDDVHMKDHPAKLFVNPRYVVGSDTTLNPDGHPIQGTLLDLTRLVPNASAKLNDLKGLVDLDCVNGKAVSRDLFETAQPGPRVKTRISLSAGHALRGNKGRRFKLGKCAVKHMPTWVEWVVPGIPSGTLTLEFTELNSSKTAFNVSLRPVNGRVELAIFHALPGDRPDLPLELPLPPEKKASGLQVSAAHFTAFYPLVNVDPSTDPPIYADSAIEGMEPDHPDHSHHSDQSTKGIVGLDFRCVAATAPAAP